jgi:hypothetical protein
MLGTHAVEEQALSRDFVQLVQDGSSAACRSLKIFKKSSW